MAVAAYDVPARSNAAYPYGELPQKQLGAA